MDSSTGIYKQLTTPLQISEKKVAITGLIVSNDGAYFATMDAACCVSLFKKDHLQADLSKPREWLFNGKRRTHEIEITSICFGESLDENGDQKLRLFSIGKDRRLFEYDVYQSSLLGGLYVVTQFKIE